MILSFFCSNRNQSFESITYEFYLIHYVVLRGDFGINKFWTGFYSSADVIVFCSDYLGFYIEDNNKIF